MQPEQTPFSDEIVLDLRAVLVAQRDFTRRLQQAISAAESAFSTNDGTRSAIKEAEALLAELEAEAEFLEAGDLGDVDPEAIARLYAERRTAVEEALAAIEYRDWDQFVRHCRVYALQNDLDPLEPYEAMLGEEDLARLRRESYEAQYRWDKWDYGFVFASGALAALVDFLLVRIPTTLNTGQYAGQQGSPLTEWMRSFDSRAGRVSDDAPSFFKWFADQAQAYEAEAKTPYDRMSAVFDEQLQHIPGMGGRTHRFQTFGHDPVLGFVFGVLDILRGTLTGYAYHGGSGLHELIQGQVYTPLPSSSMPVRIVEALVMQFKHLFSDVATPMGLPAPMMTLLQGLNVGGFGEKQRTAGELARWMYTQGYDFRHFLTMGLVPATIEVILRGYLMIRHYAEHGEAKIMLANNPKYRSMLLSAHAVAAACNAGKVAFYQGNPLAINQAEWMALLRYLVPHMKYWMFDKHRMRLEHMDRINEAGWDELLSNGRTLLSQVAARDFPVFELGRASSSSGA